MHPLELLADLVGDLLSSFAAPEREYRRGCLFWLVAVVLLAVAIGAILYYRA